MIATGVKLCGRLFWYNDQIFLTDSLNLPKNLIIFFPRTSEKFGVSQKLQSKLQEIVNKRAFSFHTNS